MEKNQNIMPKTIIDLRLSIGNDLDGKLKRKSSTFYLKNGTNDVIKKLSETVSTPTSCKMLQTDHFR